jgi:hypothetical protein
MKTYYFVGGPVESQADAFLHRLTEVGGSPDGWEIYPHASGDGLALHLVASDSEKAILDHFAQFDPIYRRGPIVEVIPRQT